MKEQEKVGLNVFRNQHLMLAVTALALVVTVACSKGNVQAAPAMPMPLVTVVKATAQDVPRYLDEIGKNAAFESVTVTPQVGGRIVERHFQDGENLKKGQLLFVIDPRPYKAQLDAAQAALAQAKAALDLAKIQFARDEELIGEQAISKQDYDTKKNAVDVDQAQVEAAQAAVETAKLNLEYCYIHSPIDGRAGARLVDVGNVVQANQHCTAVDSAARSHLRQLHVTESDLPEVQKQMAQRNADRLRFGFRLIPRTSARAGRVEFLDNAVQNGTGTVNLRATISNADRHFWPGQFVDVKLVLATRKGGGADPESSYADQPAGTVRLRRQIGRHRGAAAGEAGQRQGDDVVVTDGRRGQRARGGRRADAGSSGRQSAR